MLKTYLGEEGWRYRTATLNNLPWTFGETSAARSLFGQSIRKNSELHKAIIDNRPDILLEDSLRWKNAVKIKGTTNNSYLNLTCVLYNHCKEVKEDIIYESIDFIVKDESNIIYKKTIEIQTSYFLNLIALPPEKSWRNKLYLEISKKMISIKS